MLWWFNSNLADTQHKFPSLAFNIDLTPDSEPSPNTLLLCKLHDPIFHTAIIAYFDRDGAQMRGSGGKDVREGERGGMKNTRRSAREMFLSFTPCVTVRYSFPLRFLSFPPALCFSSPSLSVCTGWGIPGRFKSTESRLYLACIHPDWFPKLWTVQRVAAVTRERSVSSELPKSIKNEHVWPLSLVLWLN